MSTLPSAFKSPHGEAEYMATYEATMQLWTVPHEPMDIRSHFGSTHLVVWVTGILDTLGIGQTDLGGTSFGGFAALNYAIHAPDRIKKLVLLTPVGGLVPVKTQFFIPPCWSIIRLSSGWR